MNPTPQTPPTLAEIEAALDRAISHCDYAHQTFASDFRSGFKDDMRALQSLRAQLPQLFEQAEVGRVAIAALPGTYYMDPPDGGSVTLAEQVQRMCDDAKERRPEQLLLDAQAYREMVEKGPVLFAPDYFKFMSRAIIECSVLKLKDASVPLYARHRACEVGGVR